MRDSTTTQCVLFEGVFRKPVHARFDQAHASSDGGAIVLAAADRRLRLIDRLTECLDDPRDPLKRRHELRDLVAQRVFGIACGYEDANDASRLVDDPIHKLLLGRDPIRGEALASQPTLSRFENGFGRAELLAMSEALLETVLATRRQPRKVKRITVDLDITDDPTHGAQQLSFFNGHYGTQCYLTLLAFLTFNGERDQHLVAAMLRPGNAPTARGALAMLSRLLGELQERFPHAHILVRLDGGFAGPALLHFLDEVCVDYVVGLPGNAVLERLAEPFMPAVQLRSTLTEHTEHDFHETRYAARTWDRERRVIVKAEVTRYPNRDPRDNPRFVVTNLGLSPEKVYALYCQRGEIENRIKELHHGLAIDRTSCSRFLANQLRVLLTAAAFVLLQEVRRRAIGTRFHRAQVWTIREQLLKLGTRVVASARRVVLHLPQSFPFLVPWRRVAIAFGARSG